MKVKRSSPLLCEHLLVCSGCLEPSAQPQDLPAWLCWGARAVSPQSPAAPGTWGLAGRAGGPRHYLEVGVPWPSCSRELVA